VSMPYLDENGEVLLTRSRVSLTGKPKVKSRKGDKHRLYGLWKSEEAHEAGYAWLVEGESDSQTLWYHGEPASRASPAPTAGSQSGHQISKG
jgi:putative DNA primase/helicase